MLHTGQSIHLFFSWLMPHWSIPFILGMDASDTGIGAILSKCHPDGTEQVICYAVQVLIQYDRCLVSQLKSKYFKHSVVVFKYAAQEKC